MNGDTVTDTGTDDRLTIVAIAVIAFVVAALTHEMLGHGLACIAVHGRVSMLLASDLRCDTDVLAPAAVETRRRIVAASGPVMGLACGLLMLAWRNGARGAATSLLQWTTAAFLLLPNAGYFLYSGVSERGDWAIVFEGASMAMVWRLPFIIGGAIFYWAAARALLRRLRTMSAANDQGMRRARLIAVIVYVVGAAIALAAGLRSGSDAPALAVTGMTGAIASVVGSAGLLWIAFVLPRSNEGRPAEPLSPLTRSWPLLALAAVVAGVFVLLLGPGIRIPR